MKPCAKTGGEHCFVPTRASRLLRAVGLNVRTLRCKYCPKVLKNHVREALGEQETFNLRGRFNSVPAHDSLELLDEQAESSNEK